MKKLILVSLLATLLGGCELFYPTVDYVDSTNTTAVVLVGVRENFIGLDTTTYEGAASDMKRMYEIATNLTDDVVAIMDGYVYKKSVKNALRRACQKELCIFYYTGHGGADWTFRDKTEPDHKNEYLQLGDSTIDDDEIWEIIQTSQGRVVLIFDCDHSETMYKVEPGTKVVKKPFFSSVSSKVQENPNLRMLCWSRCDDKTWMPGVPGDNGSPFTYALYQSCKYLDDTVSYEDAFERMKLYLSGYSKYYKNPVKTVIGESFESKPVFK